MPREDQGLELKVGSFVLMAILALTFFIISVSDLSIFEKGHRIHVIFGFASGLKEAAPVRLAGVDVGLVKKLKVFVDPEDSGKTKVRVDAWIRDNIGIPSDSKVTINQLGILGEKYLEIIPGTSKHLLKDNGVIIGHDPVAIEKLTEHFNALIAKLDITVDGINNGILTDKNKKSLEAALEGFGALGTDLKEGRGTLGRLLTDDSIYNNLDDMTADLKNNPWKLLYRPRS
ncbi:MAG: MCE family protein [Candidatus Omnitrophica bacterium]|nr:MCE family protein [Candidatus Omnitrophota bacterium]MDE2008477.1 MCE family protein [Candidatus Omnitrophota bacterium]MDE2215211.1 MCE family protein [Candidatus Omnitrophota bacterium]MDE2231402.1 MCE family protein [Candidatus Omnitrophota bacterium]